MIKTPSTGAPDNILGTAFTLYSTITDDLRSYLPSSMKARQTTKANSVALLNALAIIYEDLWGYAISQYNATFLNRVSCAPTAWGQRLYLPAVEGLQVTGVDLAGTTVTVAEDLYSFLSTLEPVALQVDDQLFLRNLSLVEDSAAFTNSTITHTFSTTREDYTPVFYSYDDWASYHSVEPFEGNTITLDYLALSSGTIKFRYFPAGDWYKPSGTLTITARAGARNFDLQYSYNETPASTSLLRVDGTTLIVDNGEDFDSGDTVVIYNNDYHEIAQLTGATPNTLTIGSTLQHTYNGATVLKLNYFTYLFRGALDAWGDKIGLSRAQYEKNYDYKRRLLSYAAINDTWAFTDSAAKTSAALGLATDTSVIITRLMLSQDAAIGAVTLEIDDAEDFLEAGDFINVGFTDEVLEVQAVSGSTVTLVNATTISYEAGAPVMKALEVGYYKNVRVWRDGLLVPEYSPVTIRCLPTDSKRAYIGAGLLDVGCDYYIHAEDGQRRLKEVRYKDNAQNPTAAISAGAISIPVANPEAYSAGDILIISEGSKLVEAEISSIGATDVVLVTAVPFDFSIDAVVRTKYVVDDSNYNTRIDAIIDAGLGTVPTWRALIVNGIMHNWKRVGKYLIFNPSNPANYYVTVSRLLMTSLLEREMEYRDDLAQLVDMVNTQAPIAFDYMRWADHTVIPLDYAEQRAIRYLPVGLS